MSTRNGARGAIGLVATGWILVMASRALAQNECPTPQSNCDFSAVSFDKTVVNLSGRPLDQTAPGDQLEYTILMCNNGNAGCYAPMGDNWDNLLGNAGIPLTDLEPINMPGTSCSAVPPATAVCEQGPAAGPFTTAAVSMCGQNCNNPGHQLSFCPNPAGSQLPPRQCYRWRFRAQVASSIAQTECLCNMGTMLRQNPNPPPPIQTLTTNDPAWSSWGSGRGCADSQTKPPMAGGRAATCVKVLVGANLSTSQKCVDTSNPCGTNVLKNRGQSIRFPFRITNTGNAPAGNVTMTDPMNFVSGSGAPCLDVTRVTPSTVACSWGPCPAGTTLTYNNPLLQLFVPTIPPGGTVTFSADSFVSAAAQGTCPNTWQLQYVEGTSGVTVPTTAPTFVVQLAGQAALDTSTKCFDVAQPCLTSTTKAPNDSIKYVLRFANTGTADATNVQFHDALPTGGCAVEPQPTATCTPVSGCGTSSCAVTQQPGPGTPFIATMATMPPNCIVEIVIEGTVSPNATGTCCNAGSVTWRDQSGSGNFTTPDACFNVTTAGVSITKRLAAGQANQVPPGSPVNFEIVVRNTSSAPVQVSRLMDMFQPCFDQSRDFSCAPPEYQCLGGLDCGTCVGGTGSFQVQNLVLAPQGLGGDTVTIRVRLTAGSNATPSCTNTASTTGPVSGPATAGVAIVVPGIDVVKTASPGSVQVGGQSTYTVTIRNTGNTTLAGCSFVDNVGATGCMTLESCGTPIPPLIAETCDRTGSSYSGTMADLAPAGVQTLTYTVTAGSTPTTCLNTISVSCDGGIQSGANGQLVITSGGCDLQKETLDPPRTPSPAEYSNNCGPPNPPRLRTTFLTSVGQDVDLIGEDWAAPPRSLWLYQLNCPCGNIIYLTKTLIPRVVHLKY